MKKLIWNNLTIRSLISKCLLGLLAFFLIAILFLSWLTLSQSGLRWLSERATGLIPDLSIGQISGRLLGHIAVENLSFSNANIDLNIDRLILRWQPSQLIWSTLHVEQLSVNTLRFTQKQANQVEDKNTAPLSPTDIIARLRLPVAIQLQELAINNAEFLAYQADKSSKIKHLGAALISDSQKIQLPQLQFSAEHNDVQFTLDGAIQLGLTESITSEGKLNWTVDGPPLHTAKGQTILSGNIAALTIINTLAAPYNTRLELNIDDLLNTIHLKASIAIDEILLSDINPQWPRHQTTTALTINGNFNQLDIDGNSTVKLYNDDEAIRIRTQGLWQDNTLSLTLDGKLASIADSISLQTSIKPQLLNQTRQSNTEKQAIDLKMNWQNARTNAKNNSTFILLSPSGVLSLSGHPDNYHFAIDAAIEQKTKQAETLEDDTLNKNSEEKEFINKGTFQLKGKGNREQVQLTNINLDGPLGEIQGQGRIRFPPEIDLDLSLQGKNINPGLLASDWPGQLALNALITTETSIQSSHAKDKLIKGKLTVDGNLRSHPLNLNTEFSHGSQESRLERFELQSGASQLKANARLQKQQLSGEWLIDSPDLNQLAPRTQGQIKSTGLFEQILLKKISLNQLEPIINGSISGRNISIAGINMESIESTFDIDWRKTSDAQVSKVNIDVDKLQTSTQVIDKITASAQGKPAKHTLETRISSDTVNAEATLSARLVEDKKQLFNWFITAEQAAIKFENLPQWRLAKAANIVIRHESQTISQQCWISDGLTPSNIQADNRATFCIDAKREQDRVSSEFTLANLLIDDYRLLFPEDLRWQQSQLSGSGKLNYLANAALFIDLSMESSPGTLQWSEIAEGTPQTTTPNPAALNFDAGQLRLSSNQQTIDAKLTLPLAAQNLGQGLEGTFSIENANKTLSSRNLNGQLALKLDDLSPLTPLIPDASQFAGNIKSQWNFGGTLAAPTLDGSLVLREGKLALNSPGIVVEDIDLKLQSQSAKTIQYNLNARSGGGDLSVDGTVDISKDKPSTTLSIRGKDFQVVNTIDAVAYASPNLNITANAENTTISGSLLLPKASITPQTLPESTVSVSDDQVIINGNQNQIAQRSNNRLSVDVDLSLGDQVSIDGFGFKGKAQGKLSINKQAQGQPLGNGIIRISDGEYRAFGQGLVIEKGNIIYADSPLGKPGIDIKAFRRPAEGITVGVFAQGNINQPDLNIFSEPAMTQTEQLSWLVLGRSPDQSSEGENNAISQLLLSLTLNRGDTFLNSLSDTFKLDTLSIQTGSGEAGAASDNDLAELVLGKYLSPDLYVSYGIGLFKPVNVLSLEYSLSKNWKLKSETSSESSGGDLIYTIER